jgi:hypothetical protein
MLTLIALIAALGLLCLVAIVAIIAVTAAYIKSLNPTLEASDTEVSKERKDGDSYEGTA